MLLWVTFIIFIPYTLACYKKNVSFMLILCPYAIHSAITSPSPCCTINCKTSFRVLSVMVRARKQHKRFSSVSVLFQSYFTLFQCFLVLFQSDFSRFSVVSDCFLSLSFMFQLCFINKRFCTSKSRDHLS